MATNKVSFGGTVARGDGRAVEATSPQPPASQFEEKTKTTSVRLPISLSEWMRVYCIRHRTSMQEIFVKHAMELRDREEGSR